MVPNVVPKKLAPSEAKIIRDESGTVVRIEYAPTAEEALDEEWDGIPAIAEDDDEPKTAIVRQLEALARSEVKKVRTQSGREKEWIESLTARHGRDFKKMARDRKLNPFQQTEGDIRRRVMKWEKKEAAAAARSTEAMVDA